MVERAINFTEDQKRRLAALLSRLRQCELGKTYPLDLVERELLLIEIDRLREHLEEADELLEVAYYAHQKAGLEGCGNRGLPHETRMFAMHFSQPETPQTPEHVILSGDGRYWRFRNRD